MTSGHALLLAAASTGTTATFAVVVATLRDGRHRHTPGHGPRRSPPSDTPARVGHVASWATLALVAAATGHLAVQLALADFSVRYVWAHTATYEPVLRRISALLAGQEGSFLVWSLAAAGAATWAAARWRRTAAAHRSDAAIVHVVASGVTLGVLALTIAAAPFQSFAAAFPDAEGGTPPLEGRGLNPVLANLWMPPHTLLTFTAYALIGLAFAVAVLELLRAAQGRADTVQPWRQVCVRIARWSWVALSASLFTGLVWAYQEMSFGWFWSWDPVEATTLVVWLVLTAALHARRAPGDGRRRSVHAPLLTALTFATVVLTSFITRSGLHPSVHAFASGETGRELGLALAVVTLGLAVLGAAAARHVAATPPHRPWLFWAVWLLLGGAGLITWGLVYPIASVEVFGRATELDTGFFTLWGYLIAVGLLLLLGFGLQRAQRPRREATVTAVGFLGLTVVAAFVTPVESFELIGAERRATVGAMEGLLGHASLLTLLPPAVYALIAIAERWWVEGRRGGRRHHRSEAGSALAHLGAVLAIVGVTFATVLSTTVTVHVDPGTQHGVGDGVAVHIDDVQRSEHTDALGRVIEQRETVTVEVHTASGLAASGQTTLSTYPERDGGRHPQVLVDRSILDDTQVIYHGVAEQSAAGVPVTVRRIPLISLAWTGSLLMVIGMGLVITGRRPPALSEDTQDSLRTGRLLGATPGGTG